MVEAVRLRSVTWSQEIFKDIYDLQKQKKLCDLTIKAQGGQCLMAHSVMLCAASPFFRSILSDCQDGKITVNLGSFPRKIIMYIIDFVYSGIATVEKTDMTLLHSAALALNFPVLAQMVETVMEKDARKQNTPDSHDYMTEDAIKKENSADKAVLSTGASSKKKRDLSVETSDRLGGKGKKTNAKLNIKSEGPGHGSLSSSNLNPEHLSSMNIKDIEKDSRFQPRIVLERAENGARVQESRSSTEQPKEGGKFSPKVVIVKDEPEWTDSEDAMDYDDILDDYVEEDGQEAGLISASMQDKSEAALMNQAKDAEPPAFDGQFHDGASEQVSSNIDDAVAASDPETIRVTGENILTDPEQPQEPLGSVEGIQASVKDESEGGEGTIQHSVVTANELQQGGVDDGGFVSVVAPQEGEDGKGEQGIQYSMVSVQDLDQAGLLASLQDAALQAGGQPESGDGDGQVQYIIEPGANEQQENETVQRKRKPRKDLADLVPRHLGPTYKCHICGRTFSDQLYLEKHFHIHRRVASANAPPKRFQCLYCTYSSDYKALLEDHVRIHTGEKPFACRYCGRRFRSKGALKNHEMRESGVKNYPCGVCDKSFATIDGRGKHFKTVHLKERRFKCPYDGCGKTYATSELLDRHQRTHTGEKNFKCMLCGKAYAGRAQLKDHMHSRHVDDPKRRYPCDVCGKVYRIKSSLFLHKKNMHDPEALARKEIQRIERAEKKAQKRKERSSKPKAPKVLLSTESDSAKPRPSHPLKSATKKGFKEEGETSEESGDEVEEQRAGSDEEWDSDQQEFYEESQEQYDEVAEEQT